jgi:hypothetical protein
VSYKKNLEFSTSQGKESWKKNVAYSSVVEHLPNTFKAPDVILSTEKKKKKKQN